ncbi:hypothetical protein GX411_03050 [Candidatus Fermentibacteria bacterium]|nr:hypothetical protein [Candidatus Fermentibacteria bacterium]
MKINVTETWLPESLSRRTAGAPVLIIPVHLGARRGSRPARLFRNPVIYAMELRDRMLAEGISRSRDD